MTRTGRCRCGAIAYKLAGEPIGASICHCADCRRSAGAPMVAWAMFKEEALTVLRGQPKVFNSSGVVLRGFCADCGTGLFYRNAAVLPGLVDIQTATLDQPESLPPTKQVQTAERLAWLAGMAELPAFERFPS